MEAKTDRELLIEVHTRLGLWHDEMMRRMGAHEQDDARNFALVDSKITAAHKRMDGFRAAIDGFLSIKDKALGGAAVVMFFFSAAVCVITLISQWRNP